MEGNNAMLIHAKSALLHIKTDDPDVAARVVDVIEQIDHMINEQIDRTRNDRSGVVRSVRDWIYYDIYSDDSGKLLKRAKKHSSSTDSTRGCIARHWENIFKIRGGKRNG